MVLKIIKHLRLRRIFAWFHTYDISRAHQAICLGLAVQTDETPGERFKHYLLFERLIGKSGWELEDADW